MRNLLRLTVVGLAALLLPAAGARAQPADQQLADMVAAARKEGKVVILAPPDPSMRQAIPAAFQAKYGVAVEYLGGRSSETAARLRVERKSGVYSVDVALSGIQTMATIFHREKMLAPLRPALFFPDVVDPGKWKRGSLWFADPEGQYVLRLFSSVGASFHINTSAAKPSDFKTARDLLDPRWQGKIASHDPTVPGNGSSEAARIYVRLGESYVKDLYIGQKVVFYRDRRQITDGLARGRTPIAFGAEPDEIDKLKKDGFPVAEVHSLPDLPASLSTGIGLVALFDRAPNPNAARLFVNWIASQDGLRLFARERQEATTRNDLGEESFLPADIIPKPGVDYFDGADWEFTVTQKEKIRLWIKEQVEQR